MALMEWEFTEGPDNDGTFVATGKVIEQLRRHLAKNEIDPAVTLYESCVQETVGKQLWDEFAGASTPMKKAIANLFYRSRDYERAAKACEALGEWGAAAKAYAASYDYPSAAKCLTKKGDRLGAAQMLEKSGHHREAAAAFFKEKRIPEAAAALEKAGDAMGAGQLFAQAGDDNRAAALLGRVPPSDPRFARAVGLLSEVLLRLGRRDLAAQRLAAALPSEGPLTDKLHAELAYRFARLMWEAGQTAPAKRAFGLVAGFDARFKDVQDCLRAIESGTQRVSPVTDPYAAVDPTHSPGLSPPPASTSATGPMPAAKAPPAQTPTDPFGALDLVRGLSSARTQDLLDRPTLEVQGPPKAAETVPIGYVQRMPGYEMLKRLPIFDELSLDEMKAFYMICEQVQYEAGRVIIEQGKPGTGLVLSRSGHMQVVKVLSDGRETELAKVPPGRFVGEMSLIDDVPTSARVKALDTVTALRIDRQRFGTFLFENDRIALRVYRAFVKTLSERLRQQNAAR